MLRFCIWLLERALPADWTDHVIGDLLEQQQRGSFWLLRQTVAAIVLLRVREQGRDNVFSTFLSDMRLGARHLRRAPAFTAAAVLTLGVAIGATTAIFSVIQPVLLRPLPYPGPDRLAFVWERAADGGRDNVGFQTVRDLADQATSLEHWAAIGSWEPTLGDDEPERVVGDRVSWGYFRTLGVQPAIGRDFLAEEDQPSRNQVVILSDRLWRRRFGADASIVGKSIDIGGTPMTVVGVMPESFDNVVSPRAEIWRVLGYAPTQPFACRTCHHLRMIVRFKPSVSRTVAATELDQIHGRLETTYPKEYGGHGVSLVPMQDEVTRTYKPALTALSGAVVLVLLIAIANVINLQLARAVGRRDEFAIRTALGAARGRLTRQRVAESLVLAIAGGLAGLVVTRALLPLLVAQLPPNLPRIGAIHIDAGALLLTLALVVIVTLASALVAGHSRGDDLGANLRSGKRLATGAQHLTRSSLVVTEVALAAMLLAGAGLVARSFVRLLAVDVGFDPTHLLSLEVDAAGPKYRADREVYAYHDRVREAVRALPGVEGVALVNQVPFGGNRDRYGVLDADNPPANPELAPSGDRYVVSADYAATMRIPILRGRWFAASEFVDTTNKVVLVSAGLAQRLWPGRDPLGRHVRMGGMQGPVRTVIGVTGNVKHSGLEATDAQQFYVPDRQWFFSDNDQVVVVRSALEPAALASAVREAVRSVDPRIPIINVATMDQLIAKSTGQRRLALVLFAAFAGAALLLSMAGIYGVLAGSVAERTREIGVRSALGATPREIVALVMRQGAWLGAIGIALGFGGGALLSRYLRTFLFGIGANDPSTLLVVVVALATVIGAACAVPAMRAVRIDPSEALRGE